MGSIAREEAKRRLFNHYRKSLTAANVEVSSETSLICPLCWSETEYDCLSFEHFVPRKVGGKREILTCTTCNNEDGSRLDAQLSHFQSLRDAFSGHGTIRGELRSSGHAVRMNIEWGDGFKNFHIVPKASRPSEVSAIQQEVAEGIDELSLSFSSGYSNNGFKTALLRCAYLVLFKRFGYQYAKHEVVQVIRRRICDWSLEYPRIDSLVGEANGTFQYTDPYRIVPGNVNGVKFFLVIIQLRKKTTSVHLVFMPVLVERSKEFYAMMERRAQDHEGKEMVIPKGIEFT